MKYPLTFLLALTAFTATAQTNYALNLNGTNQYVSIGAPITTGSSYTKEAWVFAVTTSGPRNIMSSLNSPFWLNGATLSAGQAGNYSLVTDPTAFPINRWVHVAVSYDAATTTMRLYRDGNLVSTNASAPAYTSENEFIGSHAGAASYFSGRIDEVRVWNIALTPAQIKQKTYQWPASNAAGLVAYFKCNDGAGNTLTNATGGTNGTLQNSVTWVQSPVQYSANAISFDGTNDYITIPDNDTLDITSAITLEAWVYATKNSGIQNVISKSSNAVNNGYIFPRTDNGWTQVVAYLHIGGAWRTLAANYPSLNAWHHLAVTYDGAMIRLYINGVQSATLAQTGNITVNTNPLALGNQTGFPEYFGGAADEFRIWNIARTQAQIQADMNHELDPALQTGLVSYYSSNLGIAGGDNTGLLTALDLKGNNNGTLTNMALTGASSNYVLQNNSITILPLEWLSFTLQKQDENILLKWSTATEQNTKDFSIQHAVDGANWVNIGNLPAAGNSMGIENYSFLHAHPPGGTNYYRIVQTDLDGRYSYSETRSIRISKQSQLFSVINSNGLLLIKLANPTTISLFTSNGSLVWKKRFSSGSATVDITGLSKGIYFLKAGHQTEKLIIN